MDTTNVRWPDSLWAAATPQGPELPELVGTEQADVIVLGAGFTGLSTARQAVVQIRRAGRVAVERAGRRHDRFRCLVRRLLEQDRRPRQSIGLGAGTGACRARSWSAHLFALACDQFRTPQRQMDREDG